MRLFAPIVVVLSLVLLIAVQAAVPQPPAAAPGEVAGVVVDPNGSVITGAAVELRAGDARGPIVHRAATDVHGAFRFPIVPAGTYVLRVTLAGFTAAETRLVVGPAALAPLRLVLAPAPVRDEVRVKSAAESVAGLVGGAPGGTHVASSPAPAQAGMADVDAARPAARLPYPHHPGARFDTEAYAHIQENRFHRVSDEPLSTFSIDVDTASYANVRRFLNAGNLPPADAVRIEELINYFRFTYPQPQSGDPFSVTTEVAACPWNPQHRLALVGLQAPQVEADRLPPRNLVFLLDVSGSMMPPDKLPLVRTAMRMLVDTLREQDRVAIVVYAGASGLVLPSTPGSRKADIQRAIAELRAGGSTNGASGIRLAYDVAASGFMKGGINRVVLATDGDFNVGVTSEGKLVRLIEEQRERGIFLSVLGVGTGNLKDSTMEKLADKGNGNYAYLDSLHEARRVLVAEAGGTLMTVAKDVKIQIEFNPRAVGAYRLIGYENRLLPKEDFNDDRRDAGEIGAGHTVTALYEIVPAGVDVPGPAVDPLKYQDAPGLRPGSASNELMTVKLRFKEPDGDTSRLIARPVQAVSGSLTPNLGFAAAVAQYGLLLRRSESTGLADWSSTVALARQHRGTDPDGYRAEFIRLVELAAALDAQGKS